MIQANKLGFYYIHNNHDWLGKIFQIAVHPSHDDGGGVDVIVVVD